MNRKYISDIIINSIKIKENLLNDKQYINLLIKVSEIVLNSFRNKNKLLLCGNGGSAADAQHIAAEFTGRFYFDRDPLFAEALHANTSYLTAVANDYSFNDIYSRLIKAKAIKGDVLIGISTSGNSENIIRAFNQAKEQGVTTIAFSGKGGGKIKNIADYNIIVPSDDTPRIQEIHILIGHIICDLVEKQYFNK